MCTCQVTCKLSFQYHVQVHLNADLDIGETDYDGKQNHCMIVCTCGNVMYTVIRKDAGITWKGPNSRAISTNIYRSPS